jgi:hypothetical protein
MGWKGKVPKKRGKKVARSYYQLTKKKGGICRN